MALTSQVGGSLLPWTIGQAFRAGDIPSGSFVTTDADSSQVDVRNTWPDGSVKFAVISGRANLTANTPRVVNLSRAASATGGANVAEPTALDVSVTFSGDVSGTYTLQSCLGIDRSMFSRGNAGRVRQFLGPVMSEFHYYRPTSDTHVAVWFYVRRYAGGETEVETVVENGWLNVAGPGQRNYTVTVSIGGSTRYSGTLNHVHHTRWSRADWVGADPQIMPQHDVAYMKATRMVPNYVSGTPSGAAFTESTEVNPAPFDQGAFPTSMGSAGYTASIGVMPMWSARYYTNGDARAYQATVGHMRRYGRYGVHYRDENTGRPVLATTNFNIPSSNSGISYIGNQTPALPVPTGSAPPSWASSHHPMAGYDAYLLTGRWTAIEEAEFVAAMPEMSINSPDAFSSARRYGWCMRSIAAAAALSPTASHRDAAAASLAAYCNAQHDMWVSGAGANNLGAIELIANEQLTGDNMYRDYAPWMIGYAVTSLAWASDIGVGLTGTNLTKFTALRNHGHKLYVGLAGDDTGFRYPYMGQYSIAFGTPQQDVPNTWFNFAQVFENAVTRGNAAMTSAAMGQNLGGNSPTDTNGLIIYSEYHGIAAVAYAVDHGVPGAAASWARIASAPNFQAAVQAFIDRPLFAVRPRS